MKIYNLNWPVSYVSRCWANFSSFSHNATCGIGSVIRTHIYACVCVCVLYIQTGRDAESNTDAIETNKK